jgi:hypothetical protein
MAIFSVVPKKRYLDEFWIKTLGIVNGCDEPRVNGD